MAQALASVVNLHHEGSKTFSDLAWQFQSLWWDPQKAGESAEFQSCIHQ